MDRLRGQVSSANHKQIGWGPHQGGSSDDACATTQLRLRHGLAWFLTVYWAEFKLQDGSQWRRSWCPVAPMVWPSVVPSKLSLVWPRIVPGKLSLVWPRIAPSKLSLILPRVAPIKISLVLPRGSTCVRTTGWGWIRCAWRRWVHVVTTSTYTADATYIYAHMYIYMYMYVNIYMYTYVYTWTYTYTNTSVNIFMYSYTNLCIYMYIYIYSWFFRILVVQNLFKHSCFGWPGRRWGLPQAGPWISQEL